MFPTNQNTVILIPARAGSKGVPDKNSRLFANGPSLTERTILLAKDVLPLHQIILSTDDNNLIELGKSHSISVRQRPDELASDTSGMTEVIMDALSHFEIAAEFLILLQPTSPFRDVNHIKNAMLTFHEEDDAIVSVHMPTGHPSYTLFSEQNGHIHKLSAGEQIRRQDLQTIYEVNGLIYIFRISALREKPWTHFTKIRPFVIPKTRALDIDTLEDWWLAETLYPSILTFPFD
jgi:N-acylneuraminate cytidylyltransferase